jgi:dihydroorotase-like cyclic amidohydrolase
LEDSAYRKCLAEIDLLIDGAYEKEKPPYMPWTGSGNQRLIELHNRQIKKIYEKSDMKAGENPDGELVIDAKGGIVATGIIDSSIFML